MASAADQSAAEDIWRAAGEIGDLLSSVPECEDVVNKIAKRVAAIRADAAKIINTAVTAEYWVGGGPSPAPAPGPQLPLTDDELGQVREMLGEFYPPTSAGLTLPSLHHIEDTVKHWAEDDLKPLIDGVKDQVDKIESDVKGYVEDAVKDDVLPAVGYGVELVLREFIAAVQPTLSKIIKVWGDEVPDSAQIKFGWLLAIWSDTTALKAAISSGEILGALDQFDVDMSPHEALNALKLFGPGQIGIDAEVQVPVVDVGVEVQAVWDIDDFEKIADDLLGLIHQ